MESYRQRKRRRITNYESHVQPDAVASSDDYAPTVVVPVVSDLQQASSVDESPLSAKDVAEELCKIDDVSSREDSLRSLKQIQEWLVGEQTQSSTLLVLENFYCYGGIARVLDFMEANMDDWDCVVGVAEIVADFLSFRWNEAEQNRNTAIELAKMIVRRRGIQLLLRANREHAIMQKISSDSKHVWMAIGRTINGEETREFLEKEQLPFILDAATECIHRLQEIEGCPDNSTTWTLEVLEVVLYTIANTIKDASISKEMLERTDMVALCLGTMNSNDDWARNETVATYVLGILLICSKRKNMVITEKEYNDCLPGLIYCMRTFRNNLQLRSFVLVLLEDACEKLSKERVESSGVLEAISALLKSEKQCRKTKDKVRDIMRKIIN